MGSVMKAHHLKVQPQTIVQSPSVANKNNINRKSDFFQSPMAATGKLFNNEI